MTLIECKRENIYFISNRREIQVLERSTIGYNNILERICAFCGQDGTFMAISVPGGFI